jgi:hypothetical protein
MTRTERSSYPRAINKDRWVVIPLFPFFLSILSTLRLHISSRNNIDIHTYLFYLPFPFRIPLCLATLCATRHLPFITTFPAPSYLIYPNSSNTLSYSSESRSGLNNGIRKGGAGGHNWGSLADEIEYEATDMREEEYEGEAGEEEETAAGTGTAAAVATGAGAEGGERKITEGGKSSFDGRWD